MISIAISSLRRAAVTPARNIIVQNLPRQRHLSMACENSVLKLNDILEEYRAKNYSQEFPKRFQKDVVKAATVNSRQLNVPAVSAEGIEHVLQNIGMGHRMSKSEIEGIISEVGTCPIDDSGESQCVISSNQMLDLISKNWEDHHHGLNQPRS
mmetsp:Transcript_12282/g.22778  ORF Transcript_12282/g.22778 Transcript_12282/m.22778 type:complete len:153 (+) Transcript_12282:271-729(+)|eukprot:CAMPEP_0201909840 /NCGR_PEP_ID=MMETSP0903-20130614/1430_1 /ASSEMBLY_ACC=CAM_ASM_000552 /TAXON_ID=420261 /ORGANISM="Thalassiosira antarctica, Strain CCMP982" /LENGTH=152 /DNA_ID=CAMNT_0048444393 /DNA_START=262 /DNA_END=720 /DNA_ORIENTATION=-